MKKILNISSGFLLVLLLVSGCSSSKEMGQKNSNNNNQNFTWLNLDTVKAGKYDTGTMWTFEYPPLDYFEEQYNFTPTGEWLDNVRMSALRFANYCSASFVSEDGLIMTNNHCARESAFSVSEEDEDFQQTGFYAETLEDERRVPDLYVDQLVLIQDVTDEIKRAADTGKTEEEKIYNRDLAIQEIESREAEKTGLIINVTSLYNGGKYSLYGYKRYEDVRLVFTPSHLLGHFGGEFDNFTYPRYNLDAAFFRVYDENGEPLKTSHYFKWNREGAEPGETVFVVGNPGSTNRLKSVAELEYYRDILYPRRLKLYKSLLESSEKLVEENPEKRKEIQVQILRYLNSIKAYQGILDGLRDPVLIQKKKDFEKNIKETVEKNSELKERYGNIWNNLENAHNELRQISDKLYALSVSSISAPEYLLMAYEMVNLALELQLPEDQRSFPYKGEQLNITIENIFPDDFDKNHEKNLLVIHLQSMIDYLGREDELVKYLIGNKTAEKAADDLIEKSYLTSDEKIKSLTEKGSKAIITSDDPFINYVLRAEDRRSELQYSNNELTNIIDANNYELGELLFEIYETSIPPDATFTLRISDGLVKGYEYNGTIAPPITTFYGMYDRYYSFSKEYPWDLDGKWENPPAEFDLETPYNFVSTNDIIGGNSGSPVINKNAEIVGVAFDGNIESLPGNFIFTTEKNRAVSVHSAGIIEALKDLYKYDRIANELLNGKLSKVETVKSN